MDWAHTILKREPCDCVLWTHSQHLPSSEPPPHASKPLLRGCDRRGRRFQVPPLSLSLLACKAVLRCKAPVPYGPPKQRNQWSMHRKLNGPSAQNLQGIRASQLRKIYLKSSGEHPSHKTGLVCSPCIPTLRQLTHVHAYATAVLKSLLFMAAYMPRSWMSYKLTICLPPFKILVPQKHGNLIYISTQAVPQEPPVLCQGQVPPRK